MKKLYIFSLGILFSLSFLLFIVKIIRADGDLLTYWKLDETTAGSTAVDSSGNGYDGTPHNSPVPSTDVSSTITFSDPYSLQFDGTQWISIPDNAAFAMTSATFSVWVKFTDTTQGDMNMIAKRSSGGGQAQWQFGYNGGGNNFKVSLANGGNSCCSDFNWAPSPTLTQNVWYNIAVTIDGTTHRLKWYQNGNLKQTDDITGYNLGTQIVGTDLTLGASYNGTSERLYGLLDDVRIYSTALSGTDVADIAAGNNGPGIPTATPTPAPTPTPTIAPTATPTPLPATTSSSSSLTSKAAVISCTSPAPATPNLYQITTSPTNATVYFAPVNAATSYVISYGTDSTAEQYTVSFDTVETSGAIAYTINDLSQNTTYYVKVRGKNGCMPGNWSQILQESTTGNESVTTSTTGAKTSTTPKPTTAPKGTIQVIKKEQTAVRKPTPIPTFQKTDGYDITIKVITNGKPVADATVELHSTPMRTKTDKNGIARFTNVDKGNHTVNLLYKGYAGQEKVTVNGDNKNVAINLTIQLNPYTNWIFITGGICLILFLIIICFLLFLLKKRKKSPTESFASTARNRSDAKLSS